MASILGRIRSFAGTRNGKLALGGTAAGGVTVVALARRRKAGGDPTAPVTTSAAPPFAVAPASGGFGGVTDLFPSGIPAGPTGGNAPVTPTPGANIGQFEELVSTVGAVADAVDQLRSGGGSAQPEPSPSPQLSAQAAMEQQVRDLFARYNVSTGYTYQPTGETPDQRIARLTREQLSGTRSWESLTKSVSQLAAVSSGQQPAPK